MRSKTGLKILSAGFCLGFGFLSGYRSTAAAELDKIFGNRTYFTTSSDVPRLNLIDGSRTAWYGRLHVSLNYEGHAVFGDFNRDGLRDAAVVIFENEGGNLDEYSLAFLINDGTTLVHTRSVYLEYWAIIHSVRAHAGKVVVDMFVHQQGDCNAGPTKRVKKVFDYSELGPDTLVPVAQEEGAPLEADLRDVDRNQEMQGIYDSGIPARIRKTFDRKTDALLTRKFMVVEITPVNVGGVQAVIMFEGVPRPFRARFGILENDYVLRSIEKSPEPVDEAFLDEIQSFAYERFWL